jgi:DNA-binding transcriptional ArsR family regulator
MAVDMPTTMTMQRRRDTLRPHPTRDRVLDAMRAYGRPISPRQLAMVLEISLGSIAYHVRTLRDAGLVVLEDVGRVRGVIERFYVLVDDGDSHVADRGFTLLSLCNASTVKPRSGSMPIPVTMDDELRAELKTLLARIEPSVRTAAHRAVTRHQLVQGAAEDVAA